MGQQPKVSGSRKAEGGSRKANDGGKKRKRKRKRKMDGHADDGKWTKRKTEAWISGNVKRETYCGRGPGNGGKLKRKLKEEKGNGKRKRKAGPGQLLKMVKRKTDAKDDQLSMPERF